MAGASAALSGPALLRDEYFRIRPLLIQFVQRQMRPPDLAEDVVNEIYLRLDRVDETLSHPAAAKSYLYRMAVNLITDDARRAMYRNERLAQSFPLQAEADDGHEGSSIARSELAIVADAFAELPEKAPDMLIYSRVHGLTHSEIAAKMGVTTSLVEKYIARAIAHCRSRLESSDAASEARAANGP
ncbi:RNA polymerase sigma factor [Sphingopyxis sp. YR583]|uniref:RNA polymerase sigma factor n=1 Tax=Sphingopyxis sp. YR583 TaxID=1881047 RepID=UPI0015A64B48|nr:sigma-70 family RNA polymerase sigma factor [Sphingopyxis sp. YR583]